MEEDTEKKEIELEKHFLDNFLKLGEGEDRTERVINLIEEGVDRKLEELALRRDKQLTEY